MGRKFRLSVHRKNEERKVTRMIVSRPIELVTVSLASERTTVTCITRDNTLPVSCDSCNEAEALSEQSIPDNCLTVSLPLSTFHGSSFDHS